MKRSRKRSSEPFIDIRHVDVSLRGKRILTDISWQLREGEHWAFLGGNGAGKTTLMKLIRGELWPDHASRGRRAYRFEGEEQESPMGCRERIAFVSPERQDAYGRSGWDLIAEEVILTGFFDSVWLHEKPGEDQRAYAEHVIDLMKLKDLRDRRMLEVSEGEGRKILIARALVSKPKVLMLDEFCSGLDAPSRRMMLLLLERIARTGVQIVLATHRAEEMIPSLSHFLLLEGGKIVRSGKRKQVPASRVPERRVRHREAVPVRTGSTQKGRIASGKDQPLLDIRHADVYLDGKQILEDIRWKMRRDENWAILGKNGAGKSTLLKVIMGDLTPALGGEIRRFGNGEGTLIGLKKRIGYLSSELQGAYDPHFTGEEVVHSGFFASVGLYREVTGRQRKAAQRWIRFFGVEGLCGKELSAMSYGELRTILVVRAMVNDPDLLLLDEPCSGLDAGSRRAFLGVLEKLSRTGTRIVLVTHHREDIIPSITHVLVMEGGRIIDRGRKESILGKRGLAHLFGDVSPFPLASGYKFRSRSSDPT